MIVAAVQAQTAAGWILAAFAGDPAFGWLVAHNAIAAASAAHEGSTWWFAVRSGAPIDAWFWRELPLELRNTPLIAEEIGPDCDRAELQIGPWSTRSGRRIDPPPTDDGTNRWIRARRRVLHPTPQPVVWTIRLSRCEPADFDGSGAVDAADLARLLGAFGSIGRRIEDLDGDLVVGSGDLAVLLGEWTHEGGTP